MSVTTGRGDNGSTRLCSGETVSKSDPRIEALGDLDELASVLGVARAHGLSARSAAAVEALQRLLFDAGSEVATTPGAAPSRAERIDAAALASIDALRRELEAGGSTPRGFVLSGTTGAGAHLDHARSVARRVERRVAALSASGAVANDHLSAWLNRLSDVLWLMARAEERASAAGEGR